MHTPDDYTTRVSAPLPPPEKRPPASVSIWFVVLFAIIGLLVGVVLMLAAELYRANEKASKQPEPAPSSSPAGPRSTPPPAQTPPPPPVIEAAPPPPPPLNIPPLVIVDDAFAVNAGSYVYHRFTLNQQAHILGWFRASGGGNDIICGVVDEMGFENFSNRRPGRGYYWSAGYVVTDRVDIMLG